MRVIRLARQNKYGAKRTYVDGFGFDSKREAGRYKELKLMEKAGVIKDLTLQPMFSISMMGQEVCDVYLDFFYIEGTVPTYEDVKGKDNALSRLKRKLVSAAYGIKVTVVR